MQNKAFNLTKIRSDFPVLSQRMNRKPLIYLDNAATTQKPKCVSDRMYRFLTKEYATVHRGIYTLSQDATEYCESTRRLCRAFLNAGDSSEIIFTKGTTEAINLVASSLAKNYFHAGDEILLSAIEHHSNLVPWQALCEQKGLSLRIIPVNDAGELDLQTAAELFSEKTKLVGVCHVSNALGTINPVKQIAALAHKKGALVLVDGAQAVSHLPVDVRLMDCDFYCFSGHKIYGPTGIGVLYAKYELLSKMSPYQYGGDMIESVSYEKTTYAKIPARFEAGTPPIVETIGLGTAIEYVQSIGFPAIQKQERRLLETATEELSKIPALRIVGIAQSKSSLVSFVLEGIHPHDVGTILNEEGIAVRTGHHCAQPVMKRFGVPATTRASFAFYNTIDEVRQLAKAVKKVIRVFAR